MGAPHRDATTTPGLPVLSRVNPIRRNYRVQCTIKQTLPIPFALSRKLEESFGQ